MVGHVEKGVVSGQVVESEQGAKGELLAVADGAGVLVDEAGFELTVDEAEQAGDPH